MSISAGELKSGLAILQSPVFADLIAALSANLEDVPADEALAADALQIAVDVDVPFAAQAQVLLPVAEFLAEWVIANNTQGRPGSQTPDTKSGRRGSLP